MDKGWGKAKGDNDRPHRASPYEELVHRVARLEQEVRNMSRELNVARSIIGDLQATRYGPTDHQFNWGARRTLTQAELAPYIDTVCTRCSRLSVACRCDEVTDVCPRHHRNPDIPPHRLHSRSDCNCCQRQCVFCSVPTVGSP